MNRVCRFGLIALPTLLASGCVDEERVPMPPIASESGSLPEKRSAAGGGAPEAAKIDLADGLSLAEARALALSGNLSVAAIRNRLRLAQAEQARARTYPHNPELSLSGKSDVPFGDAGESALGLQLSQEIEMGHQGTLRRRVADVEIERTRAEIADAERLLAARVAEAFADLQRLTEGAALKREAAALAEKGALTAEAREKAGDLSKLDANLARSARLRAAREERGAESGRLLAVRRLSILVGRTLPETIALQADESPLPPPSLERLRALALERRPDLREAEHRVRRTEAELDLAEAERNPNLRVSLGWERETSQFDGPPSQRDDARFVTGGVSLPLPLFNRRQGEIAKARADRAVARAELEAARRKIETDVEQALARYDAARREADAFEREALALARESLELAEAAYQAGQVGTPDLLRAQAEYNEVRQARLETLARLRLARAELESAAGGPLEENPR